MKHAQGLVWEYPVAANATIRVGAAVITNANGWATEGAAGANQRILGVSAEHVENTGGGNGARMVSVYKRGIVDATIAGGATFSQGSVGADAFLDGYDATNQRPTVHSTSTGRTRLGTVVAVSGNTVLVQLITV
ncbi:hypothetical protein NW837_15385 [Synechococcus sp. R6-10]|uniref:hypothetical protein n=1 Tax=Synechococcus sp. R6-10 TaxID=2291956 RepID=UPI0039C44EA8